jgi:hypothetical protein
MVYLGLTLLLLQTVAAAPACKNRKTAASTVSCPAANGTTVAVGGQSWGIECDVDTHLGDMAAPNGNKTSTFDDCISSCANRSGCQAVAWYESHCYLKGSIPNRVSKKNVWGAVLTNGTVSITSTTTATYTVTATGAPPAATPAESQPSSEPSVAAPAPLSSGAPLNKAPAAAASSSPAASKPSKSSAPSTPSTAPSTGTGSNGACARPAAKSLSTKRGVSYNDPSLLDPFGSAISWAYNWAATAGGSIPSNVMYLPMLWTSTQNTAGWASAVSTAVAAGADTLLGFNEPDLGTQSNLSPSVAAQGWKTFMEPYACQARLAAPAVTNGGSPMGLTWLSSFLSLCSDCTIDVIPIHWYNGASMAADFKQHVQDAYTAGGNRPIWITEFGCTSGSDTDIANFFNEVIPWLDSQSYVERYAYFMAATGNLVDSATTLSTTGKAYIAA